MLQKVFQTLATNQLKLCDVFFPPEVFLHVRPQRGEAVVAVHDDVNTRVDDAHEES